MADGAACRRGCWELGLKDATVRHVSPKQPPSRDLQAELQEILDLATEISPLTNVPQLQDLSKVGVQMPGINIIANTQEGEPDANA